jgi:hypothetical protein
VYMGPHWLAQHAHAKCIMGWSIVYGSELLLYVPPSLNVMPWNLSEASHVADWNMK